MPPQVGSRRSLIVSLVLVIAIAFGSLAATLSLGWGPKLGLDLAGGLSVVYKPATHASTADMQEVVTILTNRVDGLGVSGATVNLQGKDVVVSVPGVTHAREVLKAVGQTAQLLFRPVLCEADARHQAEKPRRQGLTGLRRSVRDDGRQPRRQLLDRGQRQHPARPGLRRLQVHPAAQRQPQERGPLTAARRQGGALRAQDRRS